MFAYTRNLQLALTDRLRRSGLMAGAGVMALIGLGFLLAALWSFLAWNLQWGPMGASLAIGGGFGLIALVLLLMARRERHPVPTTDELKAEVSQQLGLMADVAVGKALAATDKALENASDKATRLVETAGQRVHGLADNLSYRASRMADRAEARVYGGMRQAGEAAADRLGLGAPLFEGAARRAAGAGPSPAATIAPLIGAFAVGLTLASRLQEWRHRNDRQDGGDQDVRDDDEWHPDPGFDPRYDE